MTALGLQPFLIYPAVIKLRHKGEQRSFDSSQKAEDFVSSLSQRRTYAAALRGDDGGTVAAVSPARREGLDGRDGHGPTCPVGEVYVYIYIYMTCLALEWIGHEPSLFFVAQSDLCSW